jgi:glycosyltransferase involved in cell wall biosynthesis
MRCVIVTNIPSPYRNAVYERLPEGQFTVLFCARTEGNRRWQLQDPRYPHEFLKGRVTPQPDGYNFVHDNPVVWQRLQALQPDVIVTTGINPTHLRSFAWARLHRKRHVYQTDGTVESEAVLGWKHRLVRRMVIGASHAGIAASSSGCTLLAGYGLQQNRIYKSPLCADNQRFSAPPIEQREFDVMFSGQLHERKLPMLFVQTCALLRARRGSCRALVLGDGPMREEVLTALRQADVELCYPGFVQPDELPGWYGRARLLLFTTRLDPWGVVANEAMAAGTPVLTTIHAGAAGDLVIEGVNGRVLPADADTWASACAMVLDDDAAWQRLSTCALQRVAAFTYDVGAQGIVDACRRSLQEP